MPGVSPHREPAAASAVAVTGGTGFVGFHLRAALREVPVLLLGRGEPELQDNESRVHMDLAGPISPEVLGNADVLCHLAYSREAGRENVSYNRNLLASVNGQPDVGRVVLISSTAVYGASGARLVDEESPCKPVGEYAETKLACEEVWREGLRGDCDLVVLRPTEVIGPGGAGLLSLIQDSLYRPATAALKRSVLYHRPLHYVAASNVAAAIRFFLARPRTATWELYLVSDDHQPENARYAVMQDTVRRISGRRVLPGIALPRKLLPVLGRITGRPLVEEQVFSSHKLHEAGFEDEVLLVEEVGRLVRSVEKARA